MGEGRSCSGTTSVVQSRLLLGPFASFMSVIWVQSYRAPRADTEIEAFFAENPELPKVLSLKLGVGQNIALRASLAVRKSAFLVLDFQVHSTSLCFHSTLTGALVVPSSGLELGSIHIELLPQPPPPSPSMRPGSIFSDGPPPPPPLPFVSKSLFCLYEGS